MCNQATYLRIKQSVAVVSVGGALVETVVAPSGTVHVDVAKGEANRQHDA